MLFEQAHSHGTGGKETFVLTSRFFMLTWIMQAIIIVLFFTVADYDNSKEGASELVRVYPYFQDVHVMIYIGFGFLMTFLAKYSWSALGFTVFLAALGTQWTVLCRGFWHGVFHGWEKIHFNIHEITEGEFGAGAVLISFGAVLGRFSPTELLWMTVLEIVFYSLNQASCLTFGMFDVGGSMTLHMFGAYFGLACSWAYHVGGPKKDGKMSTSRPHALFSMIGTIFLFLFWPSFNAALSLPYLRNRAVMNTWISISASAIGAFATSWAIRHGSITGTRFHAIEMEDIQNAVLAGGVVMGSSCELEIGPGAAALCGFLIGTISSFGFGRISGCLSNIIGLQDTCGVHNLHGIPGVLGGIISCIGAAAMYQQSFTPPHDLSDLQATPVLERSNQEQAVMQLATLAVTLLISVGGGLMTGVILRAPIIWEATDEYYNDRTNWHITSSLFDVAVDGDEEQPPAAGAAPTAPVVDDVEPRAVPVARLDLQTDDAPPRMRPVAPVAPPARSAPPPPVSAAPTELPFSALRGQPPVADGEPMHPVV